MTFTQKILCIGLSLLPLTGMAGDRSFVDDKARGWFWHEEKLQPKLPPIPECLQSGQGAIFWDAAGVTHTAVQIQPLAVVSRDQFGAMSKLPYEAVNCEPPKFEKPKEEEKKKPEPLPELTAPPPAPAGPPPLSTEWFQQHLDEYRNKAIDNPSDKSAMRAYLYLQRVAMDKAELFSKSYQEVVMGDPFLDENNRLSVASFASKKAEAVARKERENLVTQVSEKAGMFFFFDESCDICGQQSYVLNFVKTKYGLTVIPVSMDGSGGAVVTNLGEAVTNSGQADAMGVLQTPAMVLSYPEKNIHRVISQGSPLNADEIVKRTLLASKTIGLLKPEEYQRGIPVKGAGSLINVERHPDMFTDEVMSNPDQLVEALRALGAQGPEGEEIK